MVATAAASAATTAPQALLLGSADDENAVQQVLVKFNFKDFNLIPAGITRVERAPNYTLDAARQLETFRTGQKELGVTGRIRKKRVDTGEQVLVTKKPTQVAFLRRGLANNGFKLTHLHWFSIEDDRDPRSKQEPLYVVCAAFARSLDGTPPTSQEVEALRSLARMTWANSFTWDNPNRLATINLRGRVEGQAVKQALVVRDGMVIAEDVAESLPEASE